MRKLLTAGTIVALVATIGIAPLASGNHSSWSDTQTIISPNPRILAFNWGDCDPDSDLAQASDGFTQVNYNITTIDAIWPEVTDGDHIAILESEDTIWVGLFMFEYDETDGQCEQTARQDPPLLNSGTTVTEPIPENTEYIQVLAWGGAGQYTLTTEGSTCPSPFC